MKPYHNQDNAHIHEASEFTHTHYNPSLLLLAVFLSSQENTDLLSVMMNWFIFCKTL